MREMVWVQCAHCGALKQVNSKDVSMSDDDLYTNPLWCGKCRDETKHLNCGTDVTEIYMHYNANLDSRYF